MSADAMSSGAGGSPDARLYNADLAPTPARNRVWTLYSYLSLWVGMSHNIPTWLMAGGIIALGMNWWQAVLTILCGNLIVLVPILLNSHAGAKYGIPFPVFARASFGVYGAYVPTVLRALVAAGWFGINAFIGGQAVETLLVGLFPGWASLDGAVSFAGLGLGSWIAFLAFWTLNVWIIYHGMEAVRRFEAWAGPLVLLLAAGLLVWAYQAAHGWGRLVGGAGHLGSPAAFWPVFMPALNGVIAFWATLSLNIPDFTRFARSQRDQWLGQTLGLPPTMALFSLFGVLVTAATVAVYGKAIWDPVELIGHFRNPVVLIVALGSVVVATLSVNLAANTVSPAYDFSNLWPSRVDFRLGGLVTGVLGILIMPWKLLSTPHVYIYDWLGTYAAFLGPIAGVLIADYWWVRGRYLSLPDLYRARGLYTFRGGVNWRGIGALCAGVAAALAGKAVPALGWLFSYAWFVGFFVSLLVYRWAMGRERAPGPVPASAGPGPGQGL